MTTLITGSAGFIGSALALRMLEQGCDVIGVDNHNDYYDPNIKEARVSRCINHPSYTHLRIDLGNREALHKCFITYKPTRVVNLAAQAGIRHSIDNPHAYINSNIVGFANILEECRNSSVDHLVYASSSSVYGANTNMPFSTLHNVDHPLNLYAATKKSNELMAHSYSHLYGVPVTGLRFFTVYGPWGRPDMALFKFTKAILAREKIQVFNHGKHKRDFTYIDDIVESVTRVLDQPAQSDPNWCSFDPSLSTSEAPWRLYNIGNSQPITLMSCILGLEKALGIKAKIDLQPLQPGDMLDTYADVSDFVTQFGFKPQISLEQGLERFVEWYRAYFTD